MKYSLFFLFILAFIQFSFGQDKVLFDNVIELDSSARIQYLSKIFPLDSYCIFAEDEQEDPLKSFLEIHGHKFSFFKTNGHDTLIIFDGKLCGGHEAGIVNIYKMANGQPETILSKPGKIADVLGDSAWIYTYPCCAEILNVVKPYSLSTGKSVGGAHLYYDRHDSELILKSIAKDHNQIELINDSEIRWSPFLDDGPITPFCGKMDNIVGNFQKAQEGKVVKVGLNGWVLIRFDSILIQDDVCLNDYQKKLIGVEECTVYGWMKADNLRFK